MQISQGQRTSTKESGMAYPGGTRPAEEGIASSGIGFHLWRLYQHAWLVCLLFPLASLVRDPLPAWHRALGIVALVGFAAGYTWLMWPHPASQRARTRAESRTSFLLFVALSVLVLVFSVLDGSAWLWLLIGTSAIAGLLLPLRSAFAAVVLFTLFPLLLMLKLHGGFSRGGSVVAHRTDAAGARTRPGYDRCGPYGQRHSGTPCRATRTGAPGSDRGARAPLTGPA